MVQERRGRLLAVGGLVGAVVLVATAVAVVRWSGGDGPVAPDGAPAATPPGSAPATTPAATVDDGVRAGRDALVDVAVATVWNAPDQARPVDAPSLANPVDMRRWTTTMTLDEKLWLVDKLATQALYGERVSVREVRGDWARVVVAGQPSSQDPGGYPGWMPVAQLTAAPAAETGRWAVVTRPTAVLHDQADPSRTLVELSYDTRLPVLAADATWVTVATPGGGRAVLAPADVDVQGRAAPPVTGADLVRSAQLFSGVPYLWAGTSAAGFDCSGFTSAVYGAHGIVLPRDADDQALTGTPVDRNHLQPGDLLFYAGAGGQGAIHHVSMYVGNGMMIQSPATGKTVETIAVDTPAYAREFWGARRYLPT